MEDKKIETMDEPKLAEPEMEAQITKAFWVVDVFNKNDDPEDGNRETVRHLKVQADHEDQAIAEARLLAQEELGDLEDFDFEAKPEEVS